MMCCHGESLLCWSVSVYFMLKLDLQNLSNFALPSDGI